MSISFSCICTDSGNTNTVINVALEHIRQMASRVLQLDEPGDVEITHGLRLWHGVVAVLAIVLAREKHTSSFHEGVCRCGLSR